MKIRNNKVKQTYLVKPFSKDFKFKKFKYKSDCLKYLNSMGFDALNSIVSISINALNYSNTLREYSVWLDEHKYNKHGIFEFRLVNETFRGNKYIFPHRPIEKVNVKYFAFGDKICSLMSHIGQSDTINNSNLSNLLILFHKRGFRDFDPDDVFGGDYVNNRLSDNILEDLNEWFYWSDRCNYLRCKVIYELIKRDRPGAFKSYEEKLKYLK